MGLKLEDNSRKSVLTRYINSNFAGDLDKRRSITCYIFTMYRGPISWKS